MLRITTPLIFMLMLSACGDGQPFFDEDTATDADTAADVDTAAEASEDAEGGDAADDDGEVSDVLNTGTTSPTLGTDAVARGDIIRLESTSDEGLGGYLSSVSYDSDSDTLIVDGLGFDGANTYSRGSPIDQLKSYQVYEADITATDALTGDTISQITPYRAVYGVSANNLDTGEPRTSFVIVRTGGYTGYGFGGYIYARNGDTVIPTSGQAQFTGDYAGIRTFSGAGGLELTQGDVEIAIDLRDFNDNDAVRGYINNREAYTSDGVSISLGGTDELVLPTLHFVIEGTGTDLLESGEFSGTLNNSIIGDTGELEEYETGSYYAILSGDATDVSDGGEIVGVFVVESEDPRYEGVTAQETGGFIVYR
jgi:hypothetical protein